MNIIDKIKNMSKRKLMIIGLSILVILVVIFSVVIGSNLSGKNEKESGLLEFIDDNYDYKIKINSRLKKNKIKEYKITIKKSEETIYQNVVKREEKKDVYELDVKEIIFEKGYGSYDIYMEYKDGLFNKKIQTSFIIDDVPGIKNMNIKEDHENQKYTVTVDRVPGSIGYRAILSKDDNMKTIELTDIEEMNTYEIDLTDAVKEIGVGKYNLQVENLISKQVTGMPKFSTFIVKAYIGKPSAKISSTSIGNKILTITKDDLVSSYKVELYKDGKYVHAIEKAELEIDITKILREKNSEEGKYTIKVIPQIENKEFYIVDTLNQKSVAVLSNIEIAYDKVSVASIGGADLPVINRPWIVISNIDSTKYKYFINVKSNSINKTYEYIEENSNIVTYDDVRLAGGRYFLTKEEVEKLSLGEIITITIYKEDKVNKEKSYEVVYKMEKKSIENVFKVDTLQIIN